MPVLAVGGALLAVAQAAPVIGGILAGTVEIGALSTILTVTTAIGATVGAIGAVTGNRDLALAGGIMAGVSGLASMANSANLFGDTSHLFGTSGAAAAEEARYAAQIPDFVPITPAVERGTIASSDYINMFSPTSVSTLGEMPPLTEEQWAAGIPDKVDITPPLLRGTTDIPESIAPDPYAEGTQYASAADPTRASDVSPNVGPDKVDKSVMGGAGDDPLSESFRRSPYYSAQKPTGEVGPIQSSTATDADMAQEAAIQGKPTAPWTAGDEAQQRALEGKSLFMDKVDKIAGYLDKHDWAARAALGFLQYAFDPTKNAQSAELKARAGAYNAEAALTNQQVANLASGVPQARLKPIQRAPVTGSNYPTAMPGIINSPAINRM